MSESRGENLESPFRSVRGSYRGRGRRRRISESEGVSRAVHVVSESFIVCVGEGRLVVERQWGHGRGGRSIGGCLVMSSLHRRGGRCHVVIKGGGRWSLW